jgi:uncharacterized protein YfiM (DUF2279 family)
MFKKVLFAATSVAIAAVVVPATVPMPAVASTVCANPNGGASQWTAPTSTTTTGKGKKATTSTFVSGPGTVTANLTFDTAACLGATYTFYIDSSDGSNLHWSNTASTPTGAATTIYPGGYQVAVALAGDGTSKTLSISGTTGDATGYYSPANLCLNTHVEITMLGQSTVLSNNISDCVGGSGGGSYF